MKVGDFKNVFTSEQLEEVNDNLRAYLANMEYIHIQKADYGKGFYIFKSAEDVKTGHYVQYCYNLDYLNGWLYGVVQAVNGIVKKKVEEEI